MKLLPLEKPVREELSPPAREVWIEILLPYALIIVMMVTSREGGVD